MIPPVKFPRRIVQIACAAAAKVVGPVSKSDPVIYALASDGSVWANYNDGAGWSKFVDLPQEPLE